MYSRKLMDMIDNGEGTAVQDMDNTMYATSDELADDVKIYIRHNTGEIIKDFYQQFKIEKQLRKLHYSNGEHDYK